MFWAVLRLVRGGGPNWVRENKWRHRLEATSVFSEPADWKGGWVIGVQYTVKALDTRPDGIWARNPQRYPTWCTEEVTVGVYSGCPDLVVRKGLERASLSAGGWGRDLRVTKGWCHTSWAQHCEWRMTERRRGILKENPRICADWVRDS